MMSFLKRLIDKRVTRVTTEISETLPINKGLDDLSEESKVETYIQVQIEEFALNIYNPIQLSGVFSFSELVGKKVKSVTENNDQITLLIDNCELNIDMRDESFNGPEAVVLYGPDNLCIVWN